MINSRRSEPPAPRNKIETLTELHHYLEHALQLEHATIPPYLAALYSIKPGTNPDAVHILRVVAVEEMLHLTLAANLLNAVKGAPDLTVKGFVPSYPAYLPDGETDFQVHIAPFGIEAIETFKKIERPKKAGGRLVRKAAPAGATVLGAHPEDSEMQYYSIGEFYAAIEDGLVRLEAEAQARGETIFVGDRGRQITPEYYYSGGGELLPVVDLASARRAIRLIMEQGEGTESSIYDREKELSHYYRFEQLTQGRYYQPGDQPGQPTGPAFTVDWKGAYPIKTDVKLAELPAGSELHDMAVAFNRAYAKFLETLTRAYNGEPALLMSAVPQMFEFRNLITQLIRNPLPNSEFTAAPTFELYPDADAPAAVSGASAASSRLDRFLAFSAEVTAFAVFDLHGTGQAEAYLKSADDVVGAGVVDELLAIHGGAGQGSDRQARDAFLRREIFGHEKLGPIARNIIKMWYSGVWYELPTAWTEAYGPAPKDVTFVVSPSSYVEGLLWTAIGGHPAGAKPQGFGSWADPPRIPSSEDTPARRSLPVVGDR
ncbi:ferritin-like protein [Sorangium sp. So ce295]